MVLVLILAVAVMAYGVYLYAIGERHDSEEHLLGKAGSCAKFEKFECLYARPSGGIAFVAGLAILYLGFRAALSSGLGLP